MVPTQECRTCGLKRKRCVECGEELDRSPWPGMLEAVIYVVLFLCALAATCSLSRIGDALEANQQQQPCQCSDGGGTD
jgi:hypothetical protein